MGRRTTKLVGEICLYGNMSIGAGWLATTADGKLLGDGEPRQGRSFTEAVWLACDALRTAGAAVGKVRVFAAGGERMADTDINHPGYYGSLSWVPATVLVISAAAIEAAAEGV